MRQATPRGFVYALEAAHERARHRVDLAASHVGRCQRDVAKARHEAEHGEAEIRRLAQRIRPAAHAALDPMLALAAARQMQDLREKAARHAEALAQAADALAQARRVLERALAEREAFEAHRADALQAHRTDEERRRQSALDQDWLARCHVLLSSARFDSRPDEGAR